MQTQSLIYCPRMTRVFSKKVAFTLLIAVILMMGVGGVFSSEMMMDDGGVMHNCPFMGMTTICDMSPLVHLSKWQEMFATTVQQVGIALLMLLAMALLPRVSERLPPSKDRAIPSARYRYKEKYFDPLRLAFARGIIHSKAY